MSYTIKLITLTGSLQFDIQATDEKAAVMQAYKASGLTAGEAVAFCCETQLSITHNQ